MQAPESKQNSKALPASSNSVAVPMRLARTGTETTSGPCVDAVVESGADCD